MTTPDTQDDSRDDSAAGQTGQTDPASTRADDAPEGEHNDDQDDTEDQDDAEDGNPNHEAARYRVQRNEARAERDALREQLTVAHEQVTALRQSIVDQIATAAGLLDPGLLARESYALDGFLADDGTVDEDKVQQACAEVIQRHGIATKRPGPYSPQQGHHGQPSAHRASEAWTGAFAPRRG